MEKTDKLNKVLSQWEEKAEDLFKEAAIARKHNYTLEALMLNEKYQLIRDFCRDVRMKVIEELIEP